MRIAETDDIDSTDSGEQGTRTVSLKFDSRRKNPVRYGMDQRLLQERCQARKAAESLLALAEPEGDPSHFWKIIRDHALQFAPLPESKLTPMTDLEVSRFEEEQIKFGKYVGETIGNIPVDYLDWLVGREDEFKSKLKRYVQNEVVQQRFRAELLEEPEEEES